MVLPKTATSPPNQRMCSKKGVEDDFLSPPPAFLGLSPNRAGDVSCVEVPIQSSVIIERKSRKGPSKVAEIL
jgi:hypothetical protein